MGAQLIGQARRAGDPAPVLTQAQLAAHAAERRRAVISGGCVVDVAGTPVPVWTDADAQAALTGAVVAAQVVGPTFATAWKGRDHQFYPMTATTIVTLAMGAMAFVNSAFAKEAEVVAAVAAGTITTFAQIDAAAWPSNG